MEVKLSTSKSPDYQDCVEDVKHADYAFIEGNASVAETVVYKDGDEKDPIFECVNDDKNTSIFINHIEGLLNICIKAENGPYYTSLTLEGEDYYKLLNVCKLIGR